MLAARRHPHERAPWGLNIRTASSGYAQRRTQAGLGQPTLQGFPRLACRRRLLDNVASRSYIEAMKAVDVRELKNRLSEYLRLVRNGEEILVTDRGEVVAELRQPSPRVDLPYPALLEVVRQGRARVGLPNRPDLYPALVP